MPTYELAPQVETYVGNPGNPPATPSPCDDTSATPQKVCGDLSATIVPGTTELTWSQYTRTSSGTPNTATALSATPLLVRQVSISAPSANVADVSVGPTSSANLMTIGSGLSGYEIPMPSGTVFDLADWYLKSASASQNLVIAYLPA
jgi:hypothetical protein